MEANARVRNGCPPPSFARSARRPALDFPAKLCLMAIRTKEEHKDEAVPGAAACPILLSRPPLGAVPGEKS
jgi:hypothetical protein